MQLCDAFGLPIVSLVDTPGFMVGPESEPTGAGAPHARACSSTAATLTVPFLSRDRAARARARRAGDGRRLACTRRAFTLAWPSGELGAMGVEGAVRLALRGELAAIEDDAEREQRVKDLVAAVRAQSTALNAATYFELDDVIDPGRHARAARADAAGDAGPAARRGHGPATHDGRRLVAPYPPLRRARSIASRNAACQRVAPALIVCARAHARARSAARGGGRRPAAALRASASHSSSLDEQRRPAPPPCRRTGRPARRATSRRRPRTPSASRSSARG